MATKPENRSGVLGLGSNLDKKSNPYLASSDLYEFQGWYLSENYSITKRRGFQKLNSAQLTESGTPATYTGIFEYVPSTGSVKQVATTKKGLYVFNTPIFNTWNEIDLSNCGGARTGTADQLFDAAILLDQMYLGNGVDDNIRFDASAIVPAAWNMGIAAPSTACIASQISTTSGNIVNGTYSYRITFVNVDSQESNPSPVSNDVVVDASHKQIALSDIPVSTDAQVTARNIYRTTVDGGTYLLLDTINDNTTTTYTDNYDDNQLTIGIEEFGNGVPPKFRMIDIYTGVAFMAGDPNNLSRIWFSASGKPYAVNSNDYRDLDPNDGDILTGIKRFLTTVVAFKNNSIWNASGDDRTTFAFDRKVTAVGSINNAGIVDVPVKNVLAFMSQNARFYFYDGASVTPTAANIEPVLNGLNLAKLSKIVGCSVPSLNQCRWIVPNGGSESCDLLIWYDYVQDKWGTIDMSNVPANFCAPMRDAGEKIQFYTGGIHDDVLNVGGGYVWQGDTGGTDDGVNIECSVTDRGHPKSDSNPENNKSFSHLFVWYKPTAGAVINVYGYKNDPDGTPIYLGQIDASHASGQDHLHFNQTARRLYFKLVESSATQGLVIRGWAVYYKDRGQHNAP